MSHGFKEQSKAYAIKGNSPAPYGKAATQTFSSIRSRRRLHGAKRRRSGSGAFLTTSLNLPGGFFCTPLLVLAENSLRMRAAGALHHVPARLCRKASPRPDRKGKPKFLCCFLFQPQRTHSFPRMMNSGHIVAGNGFHPPGEGLRMSKGTLISPFPHSLCDLCDLCGKNRKRTHRHGKIICRTQARRGV